MKVRIVFFYFFCLSYSLTRCLKHSVFLAAESYIAPCSRVHTLRRHRGVQCREASGLLQPFKQRVFPNQSVHTRQYHWPLSLYLFLLQPLRVCVVWLRSVLCCVDVRDSIYTYTHKLTYTETSLRPAFWLESPCWSWHAQWACIPLREVRVASAPVLLALLHVRKLSFSFLRRQPHLQSLHTDKGNDAMSLLNWFSCDTFCYQTSEEDTLWMWTYV